MIIGRTSTADHRPKVQECDARIAEQGFKCLAHKISNNFKR